MAVENARDTFRKLGDEGRVLMNQVSRPIQST